MGKRRRRRQRGAQRFQPVATTAVEPVAAPAVEAAPETPESWWKIVRREALLIGGGFIGAVSFAGVFKVDEWLASWAARPVAMFHAVANFLFSWTGLHPKIGEMLTLTVTLCGIVTRGALVERAETFRAWNRTSGKNAIKFVLGFVLVCLFPITLLRTLDIATQGPPFLIIIIPQILITAVCFFSLILSWFYFRIAPRSTSYLLGFLALFYGWGLFVDGGYHKKLPRADVQAEQVKP